MDTNKQYIWNRVKEAIAVGVGSVLVGAIIGAAFPPESPRYYCPAHGHLRAHFLERQIAFNLGQSPSSAPSPSSERLRPAAEASSSSEAPSSIDAVVEPIAGPVPSASSVSSAASEAAIDASSSASSVGESSVSSETSSASSSAPSAVPEAASFPAFDRTVFPVARVPNWGAMTTPKEWTRSYAEMDRSEFVRIPAYDLDALAVPMKELLQERDDPDAVALLTAKLFYSTRYFGSYDLDAGEFTGDHAGIDLKVPEGTPVGAVAGGRVSSVLREATGLGIHVIVEHRLGDEAFYSIYGHLGSVAVREGQDVAPGDLVGRSGSTGRSVSPHLHLQIDRGAAGETPHAPYQTEGVPSRAEAARNTVNPVSFIDAHR